MSIHESGEDYLEMILVMKNEGFSPVRSIDLAKRFDYSRARISRAMKKLINDGYITFDDKDFIHLTEKGEQRAEFIYNRHQRLTKLFIQLGVDKDIAEQDACKIEHDLSKESFDALTALIKD